jgi:hypothetical protein
MRSRLVKFTTLGRFRLPQTLSHFILAHSKEMVIRSLKKRFLSLRSDTKTALI